MSPSYFLKLHFNIILQFFSSMHRSSMWSLSLRFPTKTLYITLLSRIHATCPTHLHCYITCIIFGEDYKSWNSSLYNVLQSTVPSLLLGQFLYVAMSNALLSAEMLCRKTFLRAKGEVTLIPVWSRNLKNEEAKARYWAVKITPQWVVTWRKQTNISTPLVLA